MRSLTVDGAVLDVRQYPHYNRTEYHVELVSGEWPAGEVLLKRLGAVPECGGGSVREGAGNTKVVHVWGCD